MKDFYIYSVASGACIAFMRMRGKSRFDIYDTGQYISFDNISENIFYVYNIVTGNCIKNGKIDHSSNRIWFYNDNSLSL